jgi:predicted DNA-binding transcriptional regulator YafY
MRHFRLDRMQKVEVLNEGFQPRPEFSLARHLETMSEHDQRIPVRIWFSQRALDRARRESFVSITEELTTPDGAQISMATFSLNWLAAWILSFGGEAEALEPEELRMMVRETSRGVLERHLDHEPQLV